MPIRCLRCLLCLAIVALMAAGAASSASGRSRAHAVDVSPSGQQYDPDALARFCLKQVRDEYVGSFGFLYEGKRLSRLRSVTMPVSVMPMMSGLYGVDCPPPAWEHIRVRLLFGDDHLRDVPVSDWQAAPDAAITNLDDPYVPTRGTLTFQLFRSYTPCYPPRLQAQLRRRLRREGVVDPTAAFRPAYVQVRIRAHSGTHGVSFTYKREINNLDRCVRRGRPSSSAASVLARGASAHEAAYDQKVKAHECVENARETPFIRAPYGSRAKGKRKLVIFSAADPIYPNSGPNGDQRCDSGNGNGRTVTLDAEVRSKGSWRRATNVVTLIRDSWAGYTERPVNFRVASWAYKFLESHRLPYMRWVMHVQAKDQAAKLNKLFYLPTDYVDVVFA